MNLDELRALLARHARPDMTTAVDGVLVSKVDRPDTAVPVDDGHGAGAHRAGRETARAGRPRVRVPRRPVPGRVGRPAGHRPLHRRRPRAARRWASAWSCARPPSPSCSCRRPPETSHPPAPARRPGIAVSDAPDELVDAAVRLLRLLDRPRDSAVLAPLIEREILWRLLTGEQGAVVRQLGLADSSLAHVARAVRWIRDHYAQPFRVEDVARVSGMSVSAFYRNFQAVTAMSPIQFQKQIRLQEARLLLATHPHDVTGVGHRVGYDSPSQFSREYRRQFGAPPSQDAARLRGSAPGASPALA